MPRSITTPAGTVEVEVNGSGIPVLILHGSPGGIDAARAMARFLPADQFETILVSRPGYLGTPLHDKNPSIDQEADLLAAALDALNFSSVGVFAWSGGGPAAYRLAVRHPARISSLVAVAAVSFRWIAPRPSVAQRFLFGTGTGERLLSFLSKHRPEQVVGGALEGEGSLRGDGLRTLIKQTMADPDQRRLVLDIAQTVSTVGRRRAGWQNDVSTFARIETLDLEQIPCPVLLIHGDGDTDADVEFSRFAHQHIPGSELVLLEQGTHLAFYAHPRAGEVQEQTRVLLVTTHQRPAQQ